MCSFCVPTAVSKDFRSLACNTVTPCQPRTTLSTLHLQDVNFTLASSAKVPNMITATALNTPIQEVHQTDVLRTHWVFVYGTLKRGFANHSLLDTATFLGEFRTVTPYPLVVGGAFFSPYLLDLPGTGERVLGEVFAVCDDTLASLDVLENVGTNYSRKVLDIVSTSDRSFTASAYVYLKCNFTQDLLQKPTMDNYQCRKYIPRHHRPRQQSAISVSSQSAPSEFRKSIRSWDHPEGADPPVASPPQMSIATPAAFSSSSAGRVGRISSMDCPSVPAPALDDHSCASLYAGSAMSFLFTASSDKRNQ